MAAAAAAGRPGRGLAVEPRPSSPSCRRRGPACATGSATSASRRRRGHGRRNDSCSPSTSWRPTRCGTARSPVVATVVAGSGGWLIDVSDRAPESMPAPAVDRDPALGRHGPAPRGAAVGRARLVRRRRRQARLGLPARPRSATASPPSPEPPGRCCTWNSRERLRPRTGGFWASRRSRASVVTGGRGESRALAVALDLDREVDPVEGGEHARDVARAGPRRARTACAASSAARPGC